MSRHSWFGETHEVKLKIAGLSQCSADNLSKRRFYTAESVIDIGSRYFTTRGMLCISVAEAIAVDQLAVAQALQRVSIEYIIY
jgi:hypothetical protein